MYILAGNNGNCPTDSVIKTANECKVASSTMGLAYGYIIDNKSDRPAGCYKFGAYAYFNSKINPGETNPPFAGSRSGICGAGIDNFAFKWNLLYIFSKLRSK